MALSSTVSDGDKVLTSQYNNLRSDVLDPTQGHNHGGGTDEGAPVVNIQHGLDANKPASPDVGDVYIATDTRVVYRCFTSGTWDGTFGLGRDNGAEFSLSTFADPNDDILQLKFPRDGNFFLRSSDNRSFITVGSKSGQEDNPAANYVDLYALGLKRRNTEINPLTTGSCPAENQTTWGGSAGSTWSDGDTGTIDWDSDFFFGTGFTVKWVLLSVWIKDSSASDTESYIAFRENASSDIASAVFAPPANNRWGSSLAFVEVDSDGTSYYEIHGSGEYSVTIKLFVVAWGGFTT